jgi:hypothetical protein
MHKQARVESSFLWFSASSTAFALAAGLSQHILLVVGHGKEVIGRGIGFAAVRIHLIAAAFFHFFCAIQSWAI